MALLSIGLGVVTAPFTAGLFLAGTAVKGFASVLKFGYGLLKKFWLKIKKWALIATAALAGTIYMAAKFQKQMAFVSTMVKDTGKWMGKFTRSIKSMSVAFGQSTKGMTQALYDILSASVPPQKAMAMLKTAATAAVAGFTEVEQVGKTLTSVMNGMGISFEQSGKVADVMFRIVEKGQLTFNQLQGSMARAMVAARQARIPFEELAASYSFLTRKGFSVAMAETAIATAIEKILVPTDESMRLAKELGIELGATALATKGLTGVIKDLAAAGLTSEQIARLFPARRAKRAISAMISGAKEFESDVTAMYKAGGAQARAFGKATETMAFQWSKFIAAFRVLLIDLVTPMLPALTKMFKRLSVIGEYLRKTLAVDAAQDMANFAMGIAKTVEKVIFWLLQEVPYVFKTIWNYLKFTMKIIRTVLDVGILKTLLGAYWTYLTNYLENLYRVTTGFFKAVSERLYQTTRYAWWKVRSFISGEAIPDYVKQFTGMLDYIELEFTERMPDAFKEGWDKAAKELKKDIKRTIAEREASGKKLADLQDKMNQEELKDKKDTAESASKINHAFEKEKMNMAKKAIREIIEKEKKKIDHLKALGQLSLKDELSRLKKLLVMTKANTKERMDLEKEVYALEKQLRERRKSEAFEHFGMMELKERELLKAKIKYLEKFLKEEAKSYEERRAAAIELYKLRHELRKTEKEEQKKLNDFYMLEEWKRLEARIEILKKRKFMFAKDARERNKIDRQLQKELRERAKKRWEFISKNRVKEKEKWTLEEFRKLNIAERHAMKSIKSDKLTKREKKKAEQALGKIREQQAQARKDIMEGEDVRAKELLKKEEEYHKKLQEEIAKATGKRIDDEATKEKEVQDKRIQQAKETKKKVGEIGDKAKDKIKEVSEVMQNSMTKAIKSIIDSTIMLEQKLIAIFERIKQICITAQCLRGLPVPGVGKGTAGGLIAGGKVAGPTAIGGTIKVGPIYVGKIDSMVDAIRAGEKIGEEIASSTHRDLGIVL